MKQLAPEAAHSKREQPQSEKKTNLYIKNKDGWLIVKNSMKNSIANATNAPSHSFVTILGGSAIY
jgi:hypothetical protein